jgi:hypothetical protein
MKALKTREGFFGLLAIVVQGLKFFAPVESHGLIDLITTGAGSIAAGRIYKKIGTPGMTPFTPTDQ